ncbi:DoxX family protein [Nostocaceae cyanobacterium CENA357]|uniref:DoxX family protein n=1 Tax=Atlanticothrix silvestris CENA357 TaxID=1725252 RepID=A0A8J7HJ25_9CYAN|nr:DoxX family protein [Atlanticothrix silvestris]MBH8556049.1 DoxX family protein [Atlanticothrix silvestris CENA357]
MTENKTYIGLKQKDIAIAYLLLRILIGVNYFNHGFTRIFNIPGFVEDTVKQLENSYFPEFLVRINSYLVPPVELIVGVSITVGLATRSALVATFILMIILKMGVTSVQNWGAATSMLSYGIVLFILLAANSFNIYSIDHLINKRQTSTNSQTTHEQGINNFFINKFWKKRRRQHRLPTHTSFR